MTDLGDRTTYLGGSDIPSLLGMGFKTAREVWEIKTGRREPDPVNANMERGTALEPVAADKYQEEFNVELLEAPELVHPEYPFLRGHPDRYMGPGPGDPLLEIKCPTAREFHNRVAHGPRLSQLVQVYWYLGLSGRPAADVWYFCSDLWDGQRFPVQADGTVYEALLDRALLFWSHVQEDIPPTELEEQAFLEVPRPTGSITPVEGDLWGELLVERAGVQQELEVWEGRKRQVDERIQAEMELLGADAVQFENSRAYHRRQEGRPSWKKTLEAVLKDTGVTMEDINELGLVKMGRPFRRFTFHTLSGGDE